MLINVNVCVVCRVQAAANGPTDKAGSELGLPSNTDITMLINANVC